MLSYLNEKIDHIDEVSFIQLVDKDNVEGDLIRMQFNKIAPL